MATTGFQYGIRPCMLPLTNYHVVAPKTRNEIDEDDVSSKFPPYFNPMDRSVIRSITKGRLDVGQLENWKSKANDVLHHCSRTLQGIPIADSQPVGVMENIPYPIFLTMSKLQRSLMLRHLARLLVTCYCHNQWKICVNHNIFGNDPDDLRYENGRTTSPLGFDIFPFMERQVHGIVSQLSGTKFKAKGNVTATSKW
jgi:hypothetical protein